MKEVPLNKVKYYWKIYLLIFLPLALIFIFAYYPIINGLVHMFYRWDGDTVEELVGFKNLIQLFKDKELWHSFFIVFIFIIANLIKMIPAILAAVVLHHIKNSTSRYVYRVLFVIPMIIPAMVGILMWKYFYEPNIGLFNQVLRIIGVIGKTESIQWLTDKNMVIPSLIFMGFPWVGAFSVLVYLAGLDAISKSIYESASLDGAGPIRTFFSIELPLILTQVRINLVLMIIGTIQGWQFVYVFLGESGGPGGIATVPGLLIFRKAFSQGYFGYGCAIGFLIFIITLIITYFNNKYVRVNK